MKIPQSKHFLRLYWRSVLGSTITSSTVLLRTTWNVDRLFFHGTHVLVIKVALSKTQADFRDMIVLVYKNKIYFTQQCSQRMRVIILSCYVLLLVLSLNSYCVCTGETL